MSDYNSYCKSCVRCSGSGMIIGFSGDCQDCYDCLGEGFVVISFETLSEDLDAVLHDLGIPYPPISKQRIREIYLRLRAMHDY
jgi:hypothetical protein